MKRVLITLLVMMTWPLSGLCNVLEFPIVVSHENGESNCTLTVLRHSNELKAVTNSHCFKDPSSDQIKILFPKNLKNSTPLSGEKAADYIFKGIQGQNFPSSNQSLEFISGINKINSELDLAEIKLPKSLKEKIEGKISTNIKTPNSQESRCHLVKGYARTKKNGKVLPRTYIDGNSEFNQLFLIYDDEGSELEVFPSWLKGTRETIKISNIRVLPGMSGGALLTCGLELVGILSRYKVGMDQAFAISTKDVISFLESDESQFELDNDLHFLSIADGGMIEVSGNAGKGGSGNAGKGGSGNAGKGGSGNSGKGGSGNSGKGGSGNSGKGGSGNSGKGGSDCFEMKTLTPLQLLIEPEEGILNNISKVVLAVSGRQVDYLGDLIDQEYTDDNSISRPLGEALDLNVGDALLSRFIGEFNFESSKHKEFAVDNTFIFDLNYLGEGDLDTTIVITKDKVTISLPEHNKNNRMDGIQGTYEEVNERERKIVFAIEVDPISNTTLLKSDDETLSCSNNNYLKLICSNDKRSFSLSLGKNEGSRRERFRYIEEVAGEIDFYFGENNE